MTYVHMYVHTYAKKVVYLLVHRCNGGNWDYVSASWCSNFEEDMFSIFRTKNIAQYATLIMQYATLSSQ